jgi:hypothetical protein
VHAERGGEQRRGDGGGTIQFPLGRLHLAFLIEIRRRDPLMQRQRMAHGIDDHAAIDDAQRAVLSR